MLNAAGEVQQVPGGDVWARGKLGNGVHDGRIEVEHAVLFEHCAQGTGERLCAAKQVAGCDGVVVAARPLVHNVGALDDQHVHAIVGLKIR